MRELRCRARVALRRAACLATSLSAAACATVSPPPPPDVVEAARSAPTYTAELRVKLSGPDIRGPRVPVIVGYRRPDRLRLEIPGPGGARLILVASEGRATVVFPGEKAVFEGDATPRVLGDVIGVRLAPRDVMDFLSGAPPASVVDYRVDWGPRLPKRVRGRLEDGTRLDAQVREPEAGEDLPARAFERPAHEGYRKIDVAEARDLWTRR